MGARKGVWQSAASGPAAKSEPDNAEYDHEKIWFDEGKAVHYEPVAPGTIPKGQRFIDYQAGRSISTITSIIRVMLPGLNVALPGITF